MLSYYGSKWRDAPRYPEPEHDTVIEPFAGAAGYSLRHHKRNVVLIDKNEKVCGTWDYVIRTPSSEIRSLPLLSPEESVHDLSVPQEAKWLIGWWLNKGAASPCTAMSSWGQKYGSQFWGEKIRERIAAQSDEIRHWRVIQGSYTDAPDVEATWFVDPPYVEMGKYYPHGSSGIDYPSLGRWCRDRKGLLIACENEGADWLPFEYLHGAKTSRKNKRSIEVIYVQRSTKANP